MSGRSYEYMLHYNHGTIFHGEIITTIDVKLSYSAMIDWMGQWTGKNAP